MGSGEVHPGFVEAIYEETEGNPFFLTELIRHLDSEGKLLDASGDWRRDFSPQDWDIPESVRVVIQRRLDSLTDETRRVLTVAAVAGRDFTYDLLETLDEVPSESLLDGLDEGVRVGMIEEAEGAVARFRFSHQMTRQTLYDHNGLDGSATTCESAKRWKAWRLRSRTRLLITSGRPVPWLIRQDAALLVLAGDKAGRMAAWEAAAEYYDQALQLTPADQEHERAGLLRRLGEAESGRGNWENAVANLSEAMELYERLKDAETVGWIAYSLRRLYGARGQFAEASEVVQRGLGALGEADTEAAPSGPGGVHPQRLRRDGRSGASAEPVHGDGGAVGQARSQRVRRLHPRHALPELHPPV
jgi:predicted ATPase